MRQEMPLGETRVGEDFIGQHERALDGKNRLMLPPQWRPHFAAGGYLSVGEGDCLTLRPPDAWAAWSVKKRAEADRSLDALDRVRSFLYQTEHIALDSVGRVLVPAKFRAEAGIADGGAVILGGNGSEIDVWAPDRLEEMLARVRADEERLRASGHQG